MQFSAVKKNKLPSYLIFFPTSRCNLSCSHCFYHDSLNKRFNELTLEEINTFTNVINYLKEIDVTELNMDKLKKALKQTRFNELQKMEKSKNHYLN